MRPDTILRQLAARDLEACYALNRWLRWPWLRPVMSTASWLGNGWFWYGLIAFLALAGPAGRAAAVHMLATGVATLAIYKAIKETCGRPRPCEAVGDLDLLVAPLDRWSFPSGHTMHAVSFTIVAVRHVPELAWVLVPFTAVVALSRVVLGLHYPSDCLAGWLAGTLVAAGSIAIV